MTEIFRDLVEEELQSGDGYEPEPATPERLAKALCAAAVARGSGDDVTSVVLVLDPADFVVPVPALGKEPVESLSQPLQLPLEQEQDQEEPEEKENTHSNQQTGNNGNGNSQSTQSTQSSRRSSRRSSISLRHSALQRSREGSAPLSPLVNSPLVIKLQLEAGSSSAPGSPNVVPRGLSPGLAMATTGLGLGLGLEGLTERLAQEEIAAALVSESESEADPEIVPRSPDEEAKGLVGDSPVEDQSEAMEEEDEVEEQVQSQPQEIEMIDAPALQEQQQEDEGERPTREKRGLDEPEDSGSVIGTQDLGGSEFAGEGKRRRITRE